MLSRFEPFKKPATFCGNFWVTIPRPDIFSQLRYFCFDFAVIGLIVTNGNQPIRRGYAFAQCWSIFGYELFSPTKSAIVQSVPVCGATRLSGLHMAHIDQRIARSSNKCRTNIDTRLLDNLLGRKIGSLMGCLKHTIECNNDNLLCFIECYHHPNIPTNFSNR